MAETKITKRQILSVMNSIVAAQDMDAEWAEGVTTQDMLNYISTTLAQLDAKNVYAKKRAAEKRETSDELRATVLATLSVDEFQTGDQLVAAIGDENVTKNMISARLGQLVKSGQVEKEPVKVGSRKVMGYKLSESSDAAPVEE